jgi:hypothetical protein
VLFYTRSILKILLTETGKVAGGTTWN